jgi:hypothetical protein
VTGVLTNAQPGYPVLAKQPVSISEVVAGLPVSVATGSTDSQGKFSISFVPPATGSYEVTTAQIAQVENATLNPVFGDLLSPSATAPVNMTVNSDVTELDTTQQPGQALIRGTVSPGTGHVKATVTFLAKEAGSKKGFKKVATNSLAANDANFASVLKLAQGQWLVQVKYQDPKQVVAARVRTIKVTVGAKATTSVSFKSVTVKNGSVTVSGTISPAAPTSKATIEVLAMKTSGGPPKFGEKTTVKVAGGKTKFTAHFKLARGYRWILRLVNRQTGSTSDSGLKAVNVK